MIPLTPRELEVLRCVATGDPNKAIAWRLGISIKTVDCHRHNIQRKLGIRGAVALTRYAIRSGEIAA